MLLVGCNSIHVFLFSKALDRSFVLNPGYSELCVTHPCTIIIYGPSLSISAILVSVIGNSYILVMMSSPFPLNGTQDLDENLLKWTCDIPGLSNQMNRLLYRSNCWQYYVCTYKFLVTNSRNLHLSQLSQRANKSGKMFAGSLPQQPDRQTIGHGEHHIQQQWAAVTKTNEYNWLKWLLVINYKVHVFKIDGEIWNAFPTCVCGTASPQTKRLLPKTRRLLARIRCFLSKVCWLCTDLQSFRKTVQLHLWILQRCICNRNPDQRGKCLNPSVTF